MNRHNRRHNDTGDNSDFTICVIGIILAIAATLIYHEEIWAVMDWVMTVEEGLR